LAAAFPIWYRFQPPGVCVVRRHSGGLEEIAKTFAYIGVEWLVSETCGLGAAPPFEVYFCAAGTDGRLSRVTTAACVPLEPLHRVEQGA